jgi:hypothetical protein
MEAIMELIKLGSVGLISGIFSAYLATRGHRNKKWWEMRVSAYQSAIEALSDLIYYYERQYNAEITRREVNKKYQTELHKLWAEGYQKVKKAADSGSFLFSRDVKYALKEFIDLEKENKNEKQQHYQEYLDSSLFIAKKCLETVVTSANKDLRMRDSWL